MAAAEPGKLFEEGVQVSQYGIPARAEGVSINGVKVMLADDNKFYKVSDIDVSGEAQRRKPVRRGGKRQQKPSSG